jgi:hypothetical protein
MQAKALEKRCSRSGCPSTRLLSRHDLADYCEFRFSNQMTRADIFFGPMGRTFSRNFHGADPGRRRPEWTFENI